MIIGHLELFVRDPQASLAFYRDILGFEVLDDQGGGYVWLRCGDMQILLRPGEPAPLLAPTYQTASAAIVLYTDNLTQVADVLRSRGLNFLGYDGSPDFLTFTDLDGNWFQLADPNHA